MSDYSIKNEIYVGGGKKIVKHKRFYSLVLAGYQAYCKIISPLYNVLPNFLIIGVLKSGTTSLYKDIIRHPSIYPCLVKEPNYFNIHYFDRSLAWYHVCFSSSWKKFYQTKIKKKEFITGEASATYYYSSHTPKRVKQLLPKVRMIILLRNPVDRAFSWYKAAVVNGHEKLTFEETLEEEEERSKKEYHRMINDEKYFSESYFWRAYLDQGIYIDKIKNWFEFFPKKQFLVLNSDDLLKNPSQVCKNVFEFLELENFELTNFKKYNIGSEVKIDPILRSKLVEYFKPHNERLYKLLQKDFHWN